MCAQFSRGEYGSISASFLKWLIEFGRARFKLPLSSEQLALIGYSLENALFLISRPDFQITQDDLLKFFRVHPVLVNLAHISGLSDCGAFASFRPRFTAVRPTDLLFCGVRDPCRQDYSAYFQAHPLIASEWYGQYFFGSRSFVSDVVRENLRHHLAFWPDGLQMRPSVSNGYMRSTYIDPMLDREWKFQFNRRVKESLRGVKVVSRPRSNRLLIATGRWSPRNPTYRNRLPLVKALSEHFEIDLLHLGPSREDLDLSLFKRKLHIEFKDNSLSLAPIAENDYAVMFFPDIGMNVESRFLSNVRIAPIQVTSNSHPVSTFGSEIDYFITGSDSEQPSLEDAQRHYSEQLLLVPGIGTRPYDFRVPNQGSLSKRGNSGSNSIDSEKLVACPWGCLKINGDLVRRLQRIKQSNQNIRFRFLVTIGSETLYVEALRQDIQKILGDCFELFHDLPYPEYINKLAECHLVLDAWPFAGNTSILDAVSVGVPPVTQAGWQFYNLAGPAILRSIDLDALVVDGETSYENVAGRLLNDKSFYDEITEKLCRVDFSKLIASLTSINDYVDVFKNLAKKLKD